MILAGRSRTPLRHTQLVPVDDAGNELLVGQHGLVDPRVPGLGANDGIGALAAEQFTVGDDLEITVHEMAIRAVLGLGGCGKADRYSRIEVPKLGDRSALLRVAIAQVPVQLFMDECLQELVR